MQREAKVALRGGEVRLALVADSHGAPHPNVTTLLRAAKPDAILHAGDIGDAAVVRALEPIAPTFAVRGNIDGRDGDWPDELVIDLDAFKILLVHIAVYGPKLRADVARHARAAGAAIVVCGHSHVPFIGRDQGITIFNPGSIGPRRFHLPIVFGLLDVEAGTVRMKHVSCETGEAWLP